MTSSGQQVRSADLLRRRWPAVVLALAGIFLCLAIVLGVYLRDRIVVLGPWDAYKFDVLLAIAAVWCFAASLMGTLMSAAQGPRGWPVIRDLAGVVVFIGALPVTAVVAAVVSLTVGVDNQTRLDTPPGTAKYIVSAFTFGETTLTLYRGDGTVYRRLPVQLPGPDRRAVFATDHRVDTDSRGWSYLVYPQAIGGEARVPLARE